jgi:hypothetical protein
MDDADAKQRDFAGGLLTDVLSRDTSPEKCDVFTIISVRWTIMFV